MAGWGGWPGLRTVCKVEPETWGRKGPGSYEAETVYLISRLDGRECGPDAFLAVNRAHGSIENQLHYVRDVTTGEDVCRVRTGSAPQVLAGIRNSAIALARHDGRANIAAALRHYAIEVAKALRLVGVGEH